MKKPEWRQANPIDQLVVIRMRMEGFLSNFRDEIVDGNVVMDAFQEGIEDIGKLIPFLREEKEWV